MTYIYQDLRVSLRAFVKSPVFTMIAVLSLSLSIGANTAIFTLTDQVLLRSLPVRDPEQLVTLAGRGHKYDASGPTELSYPAYIEFRDKNDVFNGMFCFSTSHLSLSFAGLTERVSGELVSGSYFQVLGVGAALGRVFGADDDEVQGGHAAAVLSYSFWRNRFGRDPGVIGKKLLLNGYPITVVGVSQAGFDGTDPGYSPQIRIPITMKSLLEPRSSHTLNSRRSRWVTVFGRLKPRITAERSQAALQPLFRDEGAAQTTGFAKAPRFDKQRTWIEVLPAAKGISRLRHQFSKPLLIVTALVGLVLLIACTNVANLLMVRAASRQKEIAVRLALGARRSRIVSQLLIESLLLSIAGGTLGLALAVWIDRLLISFLPPGTTPVVLSSNPDWRILAFNAALSLATGMIFGLAPALQATRPDLAGTLKGEGSAIAGGTSSGLRRAFVIAQIALSLILLLGAGLFIGSLRNLRDLDPGFRVRGLLTLSVDPTLNGYKPERTLEFYGQMEDNLRRFPGIEAAGLAAVPVLEYDEWDQDVTIESYNPKPGESIDPNMNFISSGYFRTLDIPILMGRDFTVGDNRSAPKVAIVNEKFAKRYFGDRYAVGRHIGLGDDSGAPKDITIVGVVRNTKYESLRDDIPVEVFLPYQQAPSVTGMSAYVRTNLGANQAFASIRRMVNGLDANLPLFRMKPLEQQVEYSLVSERLMAMLAAAFGVLASLLAAIGLYGMMAYSVSRRTQEIGVRMALGADRGKIVSLVVQEILVLFGLGASIGLPAAVALSSLVRAQLFGISPNDPLTIVFAVIEIGVVAAVAGYLPALRATRIDPMSALRWE